ncbi:MAG: hypothetical protein VB096_06875 [Pseudoflavonifractor sp.]|nr:hypothetical protein [Pseudoflavonifractor sp.]
MILRRLAAAALTVVLGASLTAPALAEGTQTADARLIQVTQAVKDTLSVSDDYTQFHGEPSETPLGIRWNLNWNGESKGLSVTATEAGKVLSMNLWEEEGSRQNSFGPSFPATSKAQAKTSAEKFLNRVLTEGETPVFEERGGTSLSSSDCSFWGSIRLNGLPSPLNFHLQVRLSDGAVTSFWRDDPSEYAGTLPSAVTATDAATAAKLLKTTLALRLEYVRAGEGEPAVLRYLPESRHDFYVDAAAGTLVDLTALREKLAQTYAKGGEGSTNTAASESAADRGLTEAELTGAAQLKGTLDSAALDAAVQAWKELGLRSYQLSETHYFVNQETGSVSAQLTYGKNTALGISRRIVTADARTGALESMSSFDPYDESAAAKLTQSASQARGEAFLKALWPDQFAVTAAYQQPAVLKRSSAEDSFVFAQKVNGYFFPDNVLRVEVSSLDGSIVGFSRDFDDTVTFASADGLISESAALDTWAGSYPVELAYVAVPVELDLSADEFAPLLKAGYRYFNALKPGYALGEQKTWYAGVDAQTGELVESDTWENPSIRYDDLDGHWAKTAFVELADYQVGWLGGKARPDGALTQLDCVALLASADGYLFDPASGDPDDLYRYAFQRNILSREARADNAILTRMDTVKLLLNSLGYGSVAQLKGIYRCDFKDAASISSDNLGYAALAQGLGMAAGDAAGNFTAERPATRAEAAVMLWNYMKR